MGAGPSGLLLGVMLARNQGIKVTIVEQDNKINDNPRAAHYAPSAVYDFHRAGIIDDVRKEGFSPKGVCWRLQDTTFLAGMGREPEQSEYAMVVLPLDRLGPLIVRHFESLPNTQILWHHKLVDVEQDEKEARAVVETPDGQTKKISGDYLVGADGASSGVRTALFGKEYPGETLGKQIVATNVSCCLPRRLRSANLVGIPSLRRAIWILGLQLHLPPRRLVHGGKDYNGWVVACYIRRRRRTFS